MRRTARTKSDRTQSLLQGNQSQEEIFEVDAILSKRVRNGVEEYLVSWKNYPVSEATWEPKHNMTNCNSLILEYELTRLPEESKVDLSSNPQDDNPYKLSTEVLPPNIYQHNLDAVKHNATVGYCESILGFLEERMSKESIIPENSRIQEIIGSEIENEGQSPNSFRVRLDSGQLVVVTREEVTRNSKRKLVEYYESLIHWNK